MLIASTIIISSLASADLSVDVTVAQHPKVYGEPLAVSAMASGQGETSRKIQKPVPFVQPIVTVSLNANSISVADLDRLIVRSRTDRLHLRISGVCYGKCSRLLLLNASQVTFEPKSFAVLTDTAVPTTGDIFEGVFASGGSKALLSQHRMKVTREEISSYAAKYENARAIGVESDMNLTRGKLRDPGHFFLQRLELNRLSNIYRGECALSQSLGIVLTNDYYLSQRWKVSGQRAETLGSDTLTSLATEALGPINLAYSYGTKLINHTKFGTKASYRCEPDIF